MNMLDSKPKSGAAGSRGQQQQVQGDQQLQGGQQMQVQGGQMPLQGQQMQGQQNFGLPMSGRHPMVQSQENLRPQTAGPAVVSAATGGGQNTIPPAGSLPNGTATWGHAGQSHASAHAQHHGLANGGKISVQGSPKGGPQMGQDMVQMGQGQNQMGQGVAPMQVDGGGAIQPAVATAR